MTACFIKVIIFVGLISVYVNAFGETSSCEIKLNEPIMHAENGDLEINDYANLPSDIKQCVDAIGQINHSKNISELDKLEEIKKRINSHIKILDSFKKSLVTSEVNLIAKIENSLKLLKNVESSIENLESIRKALNKTVVTDHKLLFSGVETPTEIEGCDAPLSALDKISEIDDYIENMSKISRGCEEAINKAIQNNNSVLLQKYRKVVDKSILNIDTSVRAVASFSGMQPENNEAVSAIRSEIISFGLNAADEIENLQALSGEKYALPLLANWRTEPLTYQFYAGLEAGEVTGFASNANARLGMLTYFRPGEKLSRVRENMVECKQKKEVRCFFNRHLFWPHWFLKGDYSSAREVSQEAEDDMDTSAEIDTSLEWESGIFWPFYYGARKGIDDLGNINPIKSEFMIGYLYSRGARKITGGNFQNRYYRGVRVAFNEETYFDILQGYSEGVYGNDGNLNKRWEVRAQYPVSKFGLGRVFVGGSINFGHDDKDIVESERKDSYNLYVMWQTSFDDLWSKGETTD